MNNVISVGHKARVKTASLVCLNASLTSKLLYQRHKSQPDFGVCYEDSSLYNPGASNYYTTIGYKLLY